MSDSKKVPERVRFVYEKARHHRTFHADGAWATGTPQGEVQFTFFNDLRPIPEWTISAVTKEGGVGEELSRKHSAQDITREANVTVVMNAATIKSLITLLSTIVSQLEEASTPKPEQQVGEESKVKQNADS